MRQLDKKTWLGLLKLNLFNSRPVEFISIHIKSYLFLWFLIIEMVHEVEISLEENQDVFILYLEKSCWWPGDAKVQGISRNGIDLIILEYSGGHLNIKMSSYRYRDPMLKIRRSHDRLIFNMGIPIPAKDGLYIETGPWFQHRRVNFSIGYVSAPSELLITSNSWKFKIYAGWAFIGQK